MSKNKKKSHLGRPLIGDTKRVRISMSIDVKTLIKIDAERGQKSRGAYIDLIFK